MISTKCNGSQYIFVLCISVQPAEFVCHNVLQQYQYLMTFTDSSHSSEVGHYLAQYGEIEHVHLHTVLEW